MMGNDGEFCACMGVTGFLMSFVRVAVKVVGVNNGYTIDNVIVCKEGNTAVIAYE